jgi:hypothetical protein
LVSFRSNYFFPHELPVIINIPPQIDTSTIREHSTTISVPLPPLSVSQRCQIGWSTHHVRLTCNFIDFSSSFTLTFKLKLYHLILSHPIFLSHTYSQLSQLELDPHLPSQLSHVHLLQHLHHHQLRPTGYWLDEGIVCKRRLPN